MTYQPATPAQSSEEGATFRSPRLSINTPFGGDPITIMGGTVFVMNEHGKTVSRYDLGASEIPQTMGPVDGDGSINPHLTSRLTDRASIPSTAGACFEPGIQSSARAA